MTGATDNRAAKPQIQAWPDSHHAGHEICGYCGQRQPVVWHADDELYQAVTEGAISCPSCFTTLCEWKGIRLVWRPVLREDSTDSEGDWAW